MPAKLPRVVTSLITTLAVPQLSEAVTVAATGTDMQDVVVFDGTPTNIGAVLSVTVIV